MGDAFDLDRRLMEFAVGVAEVTRRLPTDRVGTHVARQLIRCGTAPGANYAEALGAESRKDFVHKLKVGLKELRESLYWLRFGRHLKPAGAIDLGPLIAECDQLIAIFVASIKTATRNNTS